MLQRWMYHNRPKEGSKDQKQIKRRIFHDQGDSFSPLLFWLTLVSLTSELATAGYGYKISNTSAPISNLFYMDDLKLYSKNDQEQVRKKTALLLTNQDGEIFSYILLDN